MSATISQAEEERYVQLQLMALDFARDGNTLELEKMIRYGMNVDLCTHNDDTLLMLSTYRGHLLTAKMLVDNGADLNKRNARGQTPLDGVCFKGNLDMVKLLVQCGANIEGNPIVFASIFGNKEIVKYLKDQGVSKKSLKFFGINIDTITSIMAKARSLFFYIKERISFKSKKITVHPLQHR